SVSLSNPTNAILGNAQEQVEIQNDEKPTMTVNNVSVAEGGIAKFAVTLAQRYYLPITISVTSHDGTARSPADYGPVTNRMSTIPAGTKRGRRRFGSRRISTASPNRPSLSR